MSKSRLRWAATSLPRIRREMVDTTRAAIDTADQLMQMAAHRHGGHHPELGGMPELVMTVQRAQLLALPTADLYWVTDPMARLALDASHDLPEWDMDAAPTTRGVMAFAGALPSLEGRAVRAVSWAVRGSAMTVLTWADPTEGDRVFGTGGAMLASHLSLNVNRGDSLDSLTADTRALCAFLHAAWVMMMIPTLAERKSLDGEWGGPAGPQTRPDRLVTTIDLRPLRTVETEPGETDGRGRVYRHRWMVRGHWTHQPCGPGRSQRQLIYREPYIKGPAGAPLLQTEKVMVWRR